MRQTPLAAGFFMRGAKAVSPVRFPQFHSSPRSRYDSPQHTGEHMDLAALKSKLAAAGQTKVLQQLDRLDDAGRQKLAGQLAALNLDALPQWVNEYVKNKPHVVLPK